MKVVELEPGRLVARRGYWSQIGEVAEVVRTTSGGYRVKVLWRSPHREFTTMISPSALVEPTERGMEIYRDRLKQMAWREKASKRLDTVFDEVRAMVPFKLDDSQLTGTYSDTVAKTRKTVKVELTLPQLRRLVRSQR